MRGGTSSSAAHWSAKGFTPAVAAALAREVILGQVQSRGMFVRLMVSAQQRARLI